MSNPPTFAEQLEQAAEAYIENECYAMDGDGPHCDSFKAGAHWALQSPLVKELEAQLKAELSEAKSAFLIQLKLFGAEQNWREAAEKERDEARAEVEDWKHMHENMGKLVDREQAEIKRLKAALERILDMGAQCKYTVAHPQSVWFDVHVLSIARAALAGED